MPKNVHLYRTPGQSQDEFHGFLTNVEMSLGDSFNSNPFLTTVIGEFKQNPTNGQRVTDQPSKGVVVIFLPLSLVFLK